MTGGVDVNKASRDIKYQLKSLGLLADGIRRYRYESELVEIDIESHVTFDTKNDIMCYNISIPIINIGNKYDTNIKSYIIYTIQYHLIEFFTDRDPLGRPLSGEGRSFVKFNNNIY